MFEFRFKSSYDLGAALVAPRPILHRVENVNAAWDSIALIAGEPVRENSVGCVLTRLGQHSDGDAGAFDILNEISMLIFHLTVKLGGVTVNIGVHESIVR